MRWNIFDLFDAAQLSSEWNFQIDLNIKKNVSEKEVVVSISKSMKTFDISISMESKRVLRSVLL